jgi:hypothetical protein
MQYEVKNLELQRTLQHKHEEVRLLTLELSVKTHKRMQAETVSPTLMPQSKEWSSCKPQSKECYKPLYVRVANRRKRNS